MIQKYLWFARPVMHYLPPRNSWRRLIFDAASSGPFEMIVISTICLNVIAMACVHYKMNSSIEAIIDAVNLSCTLFFVVEVTTKLIGYGIATYIRVPQSYRVHINKFCRITGIFST